MAKKSILIKYKLKENVYFLDIFHVSNNKAYSKQSQEVIEAGCDGTVL
jgi:hypothetical protein